MDLFKLIHLVNPTPPPTTPRGRDPSPYCMGTPSPTPDGVQTCSQTDPLPLAPRGKWAVGLQLKGFLFINQFPNYFW